ncbi:MAG: AMP-binding protein [Nitrospinaceae bacterium]|mgnify:CR=1 FL=1|jgi:acetyl-CoA synthetase|nr:AMP-binding protein [Nitrospinaceae bacterium]MBT3435736.1 AMP-binding protein [Nitrospinaceae bacterium]MBT4429204.1 AMP-binding protein [Nitrospinaceae bacterium]MBT5369387.1 AMP-binding protein [Nitrospinaceae bacterium]MBT5948854.1 AMP-binding protein [Nitrospinaceae bacterium]
MSAAEVIWRPSEDFLNNSNVARLMKKNGLSGYRELIDWSVADVSRFWEAALDDLGVDWYRPYDRLLDMSEGFAWAKWFVGGEVNIVHNCIDRHLCTTKRDQTALVWEGDGGEIRRFTYAEMSAEVSKLANAMRGMGIKPGDAAGIFMPMIPETVFAMFACFKVGAVAIPIFSGFGPEAVGERLAHAGARLVFTTNSGERRGKEVPVKPLLDEALSRETAVEKVVVYPRTDSAPPMTPGRDVTWAEFLEGQSKTAETERLPAEARALILYTSGTTGRPKGTIHTHGGSLATIAKEVGYCMDYRAGDVFFWVTDIGWMMGPWEFIGVQFHGGTYFIFDGAPNWPEPDRLWKMIEHHKITSFGVAPTAIRLFASSGDEWIDNCDLSSLRILGSTGEPWDPESYMWFFNKVGGGRCPIMNISGGTELAGCLLQPYPVAELTPCSLGGQALGVDTDVFDEDGKSVRNEIGHLVCKQPVPSMTKSFLNDDDRYIETYFSRWPDVWYHGDWAKVDENGQWYLYGRSDDTINVAGKRVGPAEVEAALIAHPAVVEAATIGTPHPIKGEALTCFAVLAPGHAPTDELREELKREAAKYLGKSLQPEEIKFVEALPKTRSAKIVRGAIKRIYLGEDPANIDTSSIEVPEFLMAITKAK